MKSAWLLLALGLTVFVVVAFARNSAVSTAQDFRRVMETVATGWNEGNARKAADCFAQDAVYMEPPNRQVYVGREALFDFFGGTKGTDKSMHMIWHHLSFDPSTEVEFGEYTFALNHQYHGVVVVKLKGGKIKSWREYQYQSDLDWYEFTGTGRF